MKRDPAGRAHPRDMSGGLRGIDDGLGATPSPPRRGMRRLLGIDRTGPAPRQTTRGEPLRPLTIPNLVGYARLLALPIYLYLSFDARHGPPASAIVLFALIAAGDYLDGFLARATGQYSRMGALLDPVVDRLTVLCGAAVCWNFHLLPRWALVALVLREALTLILGELAVRRGVELEINWFGRAAVWPVMAAIFLAMVTRSWWVTALLLAGIFLSILATARYLRLGLAGRAAQGNSQAP